MAAVPVADQWMWAIRAARIQGQAQSASAPARLREDVDTKCFELNLAEAIAGL